MPAKSWNTGSFTDSKELTLPVRGVDLYQEFIKRLENAFPHAKIHAEVLEQLRTPKTIIQVSIPVRMDDGTLRIFRGYRIRHNDSRGPSKGGVRFHPAVNLSDLQALALGMTCKCALLGIPFGGGYGGIAVNPKELSKLELERLTRGYISRLADFIGPETDILTPDVNTNAMIMGWMADEYSKIHRQYIPAVITGKPIPLGGSAGREDATGQGVFLCLKALEATRKWDPKRTRVAIQGFGNAGQHAALLLHGAGYKVVAVSDSAGGIYRKEGFDVPSLVQEKNETRVLKSVYCRGSVCQLIEAELVSNQQIVELDVDILILAGLEKQITVENAPHIKASVIVEVANCPITLEADDILLRRGALVVPDVLAGTGGVMVSYFEWVQNRAGYYWSREQVYSKQRSVTLERFKSIYGLRESSGLDMRTAAYAFALNRIGVAVEATGTHAYFASSRR